MKEPYVSDEEKVKLGINALKLFFDSLGHNDIYKQVLLETLFEFIYNNSNTFNYLTSDEEVAGTDVQLVCENKYDFFVLDETRQDGCGVTDHIPGQMPKDATGEPRPT